MKRQRKDRGLTLFSGCCKAHTEEYDFFRRVLRGNFHGIQR
jgi:hypothetical protein